MIAPETFILLVATARTEDGVVAASSKSRSDRRLGFWLSKMADSFTLWDLRQCMLIEPLTIGIVTRVRIIVTMFQRFFDGHRDHEFRESPVISSAGSIKHANSVSVPGLTTRWTNSTI